MSPSAPARQPRAVLAIIAATAMTLAAVAAAGLWAVPARPTLVDGGAEARLAFAARETRSLASTLARASNADERTARGLMMSSLARLGAAVDAAGDDTARSLAASVDSDRPARHAATLDALVARAEHLAAAAAARDSHQALDERLFSARLVSSICLVLALVIAAAAATALVRARAFGRALNDILPAWVPGASPIDRVAYLAGRDRRSLALAESHRRSLDEVRERADSEYLTRIATERALEEKQSVIRDLRIRNLQDEMTGLWRKSYFLASTRAAIASLLADSTPFAVIALDLDAFKIINDVYGHKAGDQAIVDAARIISAACREDDVVCRAGGDEFLVLLPGVDVDEAAAIASRIVEEVGAHTVRAPESDGDIEFTIATSAGVLHSRDADHDLLSRALDRDVANDDNHAISSTIKRADSAARAAKARGKGRVVFYTAGMEVELEERPLPPEWDTFRRYLPAKYPNFSPEQRERFDAAYGEIVRLTFGDAGFIS